MPPGHDSNVMVDAPQVLTGAVRHRHLHCTGCPDGAAARLCRLSLLLQRLELACLNFIHIMFYKQIEMLVFFFPVINHSDFTSFSCVSSKCLEEALVLSRGSSNSPFKYSRSLDFY